MNDANSSNRRKTTRKPAAKKAIAQTNTTKINLESDTVYKLTFYGLIRALTSEVDSRWKNENVRYRNRITKKPMPMAGKKVFHKSEIGFPSTGSVTNYLDAVDAEKRPFIQPEGVFGIWAWLQLVEDQQGRGFIDPRDPQQKEIRFDDYRDLMKLQCEDLPTWEYYADRESLEVSLVHQLQKTLDGQTDPILDLYDQIKRNPMPNQKNAIAKLRKMIALYKDESNLGDNAEVVEMMLSGTESEILDVYREKLESAIAAIYAGNMIEIEDWGVAVQFFPTKLQGINGEEFDSPESFLNYLGLLTNE